MVDLKNIILTKPTEDLERILSPFIEEQFPSFVRRDYRKLVLFLKAYYEWSESKGNPGYVLSNLDTIYDIDRSLEEFYSHFKSTYLEGFPDVLATNISGRKPNKNTLLKHIRDFYGNKGTESAYKFLFRVLYDSDVEFYYPKEDILKTSDGRWIEKLSIKTTSSNGSVLFSAKGTSVYQYIGNALVASADIDTVVQYNQDGYEITEFFLKNLVGNFVNSNPVSFSIGGQQYTETLYSVLSEFFIQTSGSNFRVGDKVFITDTKGTGFSAFIEQTGLGGTIKKIGVKNSGINYFNTVTVSFISDTGTLNSAVVIAKPTAVTRYPGFYTNNSGKLSSTKKIQDGNYYQDFSYVLKTSVSLDTYFSILKDLVHPAGTNMFGSILVKDAIDNTTTTSTQGVVFRDPIIGNYTPYTSGTTLDLRNNGRTGGAGWCGAEGDLYPLGYNPYIGSTSEVGPSGKTAPLGTLFYGTSLGYTYCIVPEGGRTAHDPLGAPLGSTTAWFGGKETALTPEGMRGLVLWLKPENIGVCGAVVNGASMNVWLDASPSKNNAVPPKWDKWTTDPAYAGVTIDKLRPTLVINDGGIIGATGISFDGGVIFSPHTVWSEAGNATNGSGYSAGYTLGNGISFAPGKTGESLLVGRHFYLSRPLEVVGDADIFLVFRPQIDSFLYGSGFVCSGICFSNENNFNDTIVFSRSWNYADKDSSVQSIYYSIGADGTKRYLSPNSPVNATGLFGFTPWGSSISTTSLSDRKFIVYDPHVSGACMGMIIGEAQRDDIGVLYAYVNGDRATNYSKSTGLYISSVSAISVSESPTPVCGVTLSIGRFGAIARSTVSSNNPFGDSSWVSSAITNTPYGFRGVLNEVVVFDRKLQEEERQQIYGYLARKYKMDTKLPDSYYLAHASGYEKGLTYWQIAHHPNSKNLLTVPAGISFTGITITNFLNMPETIYKSKGTVLSGGTVLTGDTYGYLENTGA